MIFSQIRLVVLLVQSCVHLSSSSSSVRNVLWLNGAS